MTPLDHHINRLRKLVMNEATRLDDLAETALNLGDQEIAEKLCQKAQALRRVQPKLAKLSHTPATSGGTGVSPQPDVEEVGMLEVYLIALTELNRLENNRLRDPERILILRKLIGKVRSLYRLTLQPT